MINGSTKRTNNFKKDLMVKTGSASPSDYYKSGFDRGHLAPAADMKLNKIMMSESFLMTNISPQNGSFNKGGWKKLEELVRSWGSYKTLYITTAGLLNQPQANTGMRIAPMYTQRGLQLKVDDPYKRRRI